MSDVDIYNLNNQVLRHQTFPAKRQRCSDTYKLLNMKKQATSHQHLEYNNLLPQFVYNSSQISQANAFASQQPSPY